MAAAIQYSEADLAKMTKKQMKRILKEDHNKTDDELMLGHLCKPNRTMILGCQEAAGVWWWWFKWNFECC